MSGQSDPNSDKNAYFILWAIFGVFAIGGAVWYMFEDQIKWLFVQWRWLELEVVALFYDKYDKLLIQVQNFDHRMLDLPIAMDLSEHVGSALRWPLGLLMLVMIYFMQVGNNILRFKKAHNMITLADQEQENWPQIAPVLKLGLVDKSIHEGNWAMGRTPMQYAKKMKLLKVEKVPPKARRSTEDFKITVLEDKARRAFAMQLGPLFKSVHHMPPHIRALFTVFASRAANDKGSATKLLEQLSKSAAKGTIDYSNVMTLLRKHFNHKAVQKVMQHHAYVTTVMITMLELARTDGVLASADFIWLKQVDRKMWYVLNNVGRQTAWSEVAGIYAHWHAERELMRPLRFPMVDEAVRALERAMEQVVYVPAEGEEIPMAETN